ncbi:MAG TPA: hypothetical protein GXX49_00040 [Clostridiaceae bacterium]|nr:hypothetical protein [Clostridiaceae bacterium]
MDSFIEKIVERKKTAKDLLFSVGIVLLCAIVIFIIPAIPYINYMPLVFMAGAVYGAYLLIRSRNIEFEYSVTNGEIDIDKIIARSRRKRVFSGSCKDFEILAPLKSSQHTQSIQNIPKRIEAVSSMESQDVYFFVTNFQGERTVVYFEPSEKMLNAFRLFIPSKIFK